MESNFIIEYFRTTEYNKTYKNFLNIICIFLQFLKN